MNPDTAVVLENVDVVLCISVVDGPFGVEFEFGKKADVFWLRFSVTVVRSLKRR